MNMNIWKALRTVPGTESTAVYINVCYYHCYKIESHRISHKEKLLNCTIQKWKGKGLEKNTGKRLFSHTLFQRLSGEKGRRREPSHTS